MDKRPLKILMCADDPHANLSYGILSDMLIPHWYKHYILDYCSLQYQMGKPIPIRDENGKIMYVKYPAHNQGERNPTFLPQIFNNTKPDYFWTNFDIQHYNNAKKYVPSHPLWIGWIPWDNHDATQIPRAEKAFERIDVKVGISKFGYDFLNENGLEMDNWIYNCIDTDAYTPLKKDDPKIQQFKRNNPWYKENTKILLFVGRPNWRKRIIHMFKIIEELYKRGNDDFMFFFHSNMDDPAAAGVNIRELIDASAINKKVIRSNFSWDIGISKEELNIVYNMADLYIAPHAGEGFCMPIVEAMASGTPFIASNICTTPEFAGENNERGFGAPVEVPREHDGRPRLDKGVVRPHPKINEFCDIIEQVWNDKQRLKKMGENGVKWARENCSITSVAKKWRKVFDKYDINMGHLIDYKK